MGAPILDGTIDQDQRDKFLDEVNAAFARLRADPDAWKEERAERQAAGCRSRRAIPSPNERDRRSDARRNTNGFVSVLFSSRTTLWSVPSSAARFLLGLRGWLRDNGKPSLKRKLSSYSRHCPVNRSRQQLVDLYASLKMAQQGRGAARRDRPPDHCKRPRLPIKATILSRESGFTGVISHNAASGPSTWHKSEMPTPRSRGLLPDRRRSARNSLGH